MLGDTTGHFYRNSRGFCTGKELKGRESTGKTHGGLSPLHGFWDTFGPSPSPWLSQPVNAWSNPKRFTGNSGKTSEGEEKKARGNKLATERRSRPGRSMFPLAKSLRATAPFSAFPGPRPRRSPTSCPQGTALPAAPAQAGRGVPGGRVPPSAQRPRGSAFPYLCRWRQDGEAGEVSAGCLRGFPLPRHPWAVRACRGPGRRAAGLPRGSG